jgi:hypothetical protein
VKEKKTHLVFSLRTNEGNQMRGKPIQFEQAQVYMRARKQQLSQAQAAEIAGISERSGRRVETNTHQSGRGKPRGRKPDPLAKVWERELLPKLEAEPRLEPMTLYEYLLEQYPGQYEGVLRTLQRRVQEWKAAHGAPKTVMFEQEHQPGVMGLSDFTHLKQMEVTVNGQPFVHLLYHYRLAYSGWQSVSIIQGGESFIGLSTGLQKALWDCGGVPQQHRTDSLSAAYRNLGGRRHSPLTQLYEGLCHHYRLQPTRNNKGVAHENGAIEAPHGHFKRRLTQALLLRGSCDFESVTAYQQFIDQVVDKQNARCQTKFAEEQPHLQPLPHYRYVDYEELSVRVSCFSSINVRAVVYSVPSRLMGQQLTLHLYHDRLVGYLGQQQVVELNRVHVPGSGKIRRARNINYRHVVDSLRRKPKAFLHCAWQHDLLPNDEWRDLWQQIRSTGDLDQGARIIVEALYIAAQQDQESGVADYLKEQLQHNCLTLSGLQQHFQSAISAPPPVSVQQHDLTHYDQLLNYGSSFPQPSAELALRESNSPSENPETVPHPDSLATPGATGHSGTLVLRAVLACFVRMGNPKPTHRENPTGTARGATPEWQKLNQLRLRPLPHPESSHGHALSPGFRLGATRGQYSDFRPQWNGKNSFGEQFGAISN